MALANKVLRELQGMHKNSPFLYLKNGKNLWEGGCAPPRIPPPRCLWRSTSGAPFRRIGHPAL